MFHKDTSYCFPLHHIFNCLKNIKKSSAFTLIELLVVVLIIGILAAIAVPQYQKAVLRSRTAEAIINIKNIANAQEVYMIENGAPTYNFEDLSITLKPECTGDTCKVGKWNYLLHSGISAVGAGYEIKDPATNATLSFYYKVEKTSGYPNWEAGEFACLPRDNAMWVSLCKSLAGPNAKTATFSDGYNSATGYIWK